MPKDDLTPEEIEALGGQPTDQAASSSDLSGGCLELLCARHATVADRLAERLSFLLRLPIEVRSDVLHSQSFGRFLADVGQPAHLFVVDSPESAVPLLLEMSPSILRPMIARLLGGDPNRLSPVRRALTEIEQRLASRLVGVLLDELCEIWSDCFALPREIARIETDPHAVAFLPPAEPVLSAKYDLSLGEHRGSIILCIPAALITTSSDETPSGKTADQIHHALDESLVELRVTLGTTRATAGELLRLDVGDVIVSDQPADESLKIDVDGRKQLHARPGIHEGKKAIQIERVSDNTDS